MKEQLQEYYNQLDKQHKEFQDKHKKYKPGNCGLHYDKQSMSMSEKAILKNIKEQKLCIKKILKLIEEI